MKIMITFDKPVIARIDYLSVGIAGILVKPEYARTTFTHQRDGNHFRIEKYNDLLAFQRRLFGKAEDGVAAFEPRRCNFSRSRDFLFTLIGFRNLDSSISKMFAFHDD